MTRPHPPLDRLISKLITVLSEEIRMYNELLLVLRQKQSSIIEGKLQELKEAVNREQALLKSGDEAARTREASIKEINEALPGEEDIRTLSQLIELVESTYAERLADIHHSLKRILEEVMLINEENRYLLNYSIRFVREAARELIKSSEQFPVYTAAGKGQEESSSSGLIEGRI